MMHRILPATTLLLLILALAAIPGRPDYAVASGLGGDSTWKRRPTGGVDSATAIERLTASLQRILVEAEEMRGARISVAVRSLKSGRTLFALNPDNPLTPASTTKLVTTYTALCELGPAYRIKTVIAAENRPREGVVRGDIYVKGYGDPFLTVNEIDELVDQLKSQGVRAVQGRAIGDGTFFDNVTSRFEYSGDSDDPEAVAPIEALTVQGGWFNVIVASTSIAGQPLNVQTYPHSDAFEISTTATVASTPVRRRRGGGRKSVDALARHVDPLVQEVDRRGLKVVVTDGPDGRQVITVSGTLPPRKTASYKYRMKSPPTVIAGMASERLRRYGISIGGLPGSGATPPRAKVIAETSRPLMEILRLVMKNSNNFLAEHVFKMIGGTARVGGSTAASAVARITARMAIANVGFGRCMVHDGSGLSRRNALSAEALAGILEAADNDRQVFEALYATMSIAGVDGTLRRRMKGTAAAGNAHGKTGTLRNASALAGYVTTRDGEMLCFALLMNGPNVGAYRGAQDKVIAQLASFSYKDGATSQSTPTVKAVGPTAGRKR